MKTGIDTYNKSVIDWKIEEVEALHYVSENNTSISKTKGLNVAIKPSVLLFGRSELLSLTQLEKANKKINLDNNWKDNINRIDIATDTTKDINQNESEFLLYAELINATVSGSNKLVFRTVKGINRLGNIKTNGQTINLTIYDCSDKDRNNYNTRIEFRSTKIRNTDNLIENSISHINKVIKINKECIQFLEVIENRYIKELTKIYHKEKVKKVRNFTEFVVKYEKYFLTSRILKIVYQESEMKSNYRIWLQRFKNSRTEALNFALKKDINKLIKDITKEYKLLLKS